MRRGSRLASLRPALRLLLAAMLLAAGGAHAFYADADGDGDPDEPGAEAEATQPAARVRAGGAETVELRGASYRLVVNAPNPSRDLLARHLDVARFRDQPDLSRSEIARLAAATEAQARSLLETQGYFSPDVEVQRSDAADGEPATITVSVDPGRPARIADVQLEMQGQMLDLINAGDARSQRRWQRLQSRWTLQRGARFTQDAWSAAKTALITQLRNNGYATAAYAGTSAQVDATENSVKLLVIVDSGPLFRIGEARVEGLARTPPSAALNVLPFEMGETYSERDLLDWQEAIQKLGLYEGIAVELDPDVERAERAVVTARLREAPMQQASPSIGYSSSTGPRVGIEYTHRRPFDKDWIFNTKIKLGRDERVATADLISYPREKGYRWLVGARADYLDAGGSITTSQRLRFGRSLDTLNFDRLNYLEYNQTSVETDNTRTTDRAVSANVEWIRLGVNNATFPTRGLTLNLQTGVGLAHDSDGDNGPFARLYGRAVLYQPLVAGWLGVARVEAGQVIRRDAQGIPDSLLFRTGGDDSVRGYGYQTLGPQRDGATVGGAVLAAGSIELMHRLSERWRDWYGAVFVDAGNAANEWGELNPAYGYGFGVRWRSPVGPMRIDLAYGEEAHSVRLHLSVGITF
ncbi:autotransporter assembly complex protein TamA [Caldimonas sp. KR1-144]|uniref:autotransporter assembly complex protein TamA n=1 Tax=Caldimonas sp. KR1-144 TaxID=3400911 RepID=UPI003BFE53B9